MPTSSAKSRIAVSVLANGLRGLLSFTTVLILARGLGTERYGNFAFLLGTFMALRALLSMGIPEAFYTFMSQKPRGGIFLTIYAGWNLVQFLLPLFFIGIFFPDEWVNWIWVGQKRELVLLSFVAVFLQQQGWHIMVQIGESTRLTYRVQIMNLLIALTHLLAICSFWIVDLLSLQVIFIIITAEYVVAIVAGVKVFKVSKLPRGSFDFQKVLREYFSFCSPLVIFSLLGFAYEFFDRWLLQNFGGSEEQALYEIGYRFSTVGLLVTTAMLNIFWKEFAEARETKNLARMRIIYTKASRFLFAFGAIVSGFLIPWSKEIVQVFLGPAYSAGVPVLIIMLVFSIYLGAGQLNTTLMYAAKKTKEHFFFSTIGMALSLPLSYFLLAPNEAMIPGLELGAIGMAIKKTIYTALMLYFFVWWIHRNYSWKHDWAYLVVGLAGPLILGWAAHKAAIVLIAPVLSGLIFSIGIAFIFYIVMVGIMIWIVPWFMGLQRDEFLTHLKKPFKIAGR